MGHGTYEYTEAKTGINFSVTGDFPMFQQDDISFKKAELIVSPWSYIQNASQIVLPTIKQQLAKFELDRIEARDARLGGFIGQSCIINFDAIASTYELHFVEPDGSPSFMNIEASKKGISLSYRNYQADEDILAKALSRMLGGDASLPLDTVMENAYFFPREFEFAKREMEHLSTIVDKIVAQNSLWDKNFSPKQNFIRLIPFTQDPYYGFQILNRIKEFKGLKLMGPNEHLYATIKLGVKVAITSVGEVEGMYMATDRDLEIIALPHGLGFGLYSGAGYRKGNKNQLVAVVNGKDVQYHPLVGKMTTDNYSPAMIPFSIPCDAGSAAEIDGVIKEMLAARLDSNFDASYRGAFDPLKNEYRGIIFVPTHNSRSVYISDLPLLLGETSRFLLEKVGVRSLPSPDYFPRLSG